MAKARVSFGRCGRKGVAFVAVAALIGVGMFAHSGMASPMPDIDYTFGPDGRAQCADQEIDFPVTAKTGLNPNAFVRREGDQFKLDGCEAEFIFAGFNAWEVLELASDAPPPFRWTPKCGREHLISVLNRAAEDGLTVMRAWAHTITEGWAMQTSPGVYREEIFKGMDFIMDEARKRGIKIIWAFADNWYPVGGIDQYVKWSTTAKDHNDFFTDAKAKQLYKDNIRAIVNRKNSINGRVYKDDPTIFGWNLANEARCKGCGNAPMQDWISDICSFTKSQDPNHLVGIGYEGFYGPGSGYEKKLNPADWATREGQNFVENSKISCIDYVGIHVWPDNWELVSADFQKEFIKGAIENAKALGKPFVLEEYGKIVVDSRSHSVRNEYFESAFSVAEENVANGGILKGDLFWHWYDEGVGPGRYGVRTSHSTWDLIKRHADNMNAKSGATSC